MNPTPEQLYKIRLDIEALPGNSKEVVDAIYQAMEKLLKQQPQLINNSKRVNAEIKKLNDGFKTYGSTLGGATQTTKALTSTLTSFVAGLGVASLNLNSMVTTGIKFNNQLSLLNVSLRKYGSSADQTSNAIKRISNNTGLAQNEIANFMKSFEKGFNFVSLERGEKLLKNIQNVVGYDTQAIGEMSGNLAAFAQQFPGLEQSIVRLNKADKERLATSAKSLVLSGQINISQYKGIQDYLMGNGKLSAADKDRQNQLQATQKAIENIQKAFTDFALKISNTVLPVVQGLLNVLSQFPETISTIGISLASAGILKYVGAFKLLGSMSVAGKSLGGIAGKAGGFAGNAGTTLLNSGTLTKFGLNSGGGVVNLAKGAGVAAAIFGASNNFLKSGTTTTNGTTGQGYNLRDSTASLPSWLGGSGLGGVTNRQLSAGTNIGAGVLAATIFPPAAVAIGLAQVGEGMIEAYEDGLRKQDKADDDAAKDRYKKNREEFNSTTSVKKLIGSGDLKGAFNKQNTGTAIEKEAAANQLIAYQNIFQNIKTSFSELASIQSSLNQETNEWIGMIGPVGAESLSKINAMTGETRDILDEQLKANEKVLTIQTLSSNAQSAQKKEKLDDLNKQYAQENDIELKKQILFEIQDNQNALTQVENNLKSKNKQIEADNIKIMKQKVQLTIEATKAFDPQLRLQQSQTGLMEAQLELIGAMGVGLSASAEQRMAVSAQLGKEMEQMQAQAKVFQDRIANLSRESGPEAAAETLAIQEQLNKKNTEILNIEIKRANITKSIRDGYVGAIQAMTAGSGLISKIMVTQDKNLGSSLKNIKIVQSLSSGGLGGGSTESAKFGAGGFTDSANRESEMYDTYNQAGGILGGTRSMQARLKSQIAGVTSGAAAAAGDNAFTTSASISGASGTTGVVRVGEKQASILGQILQVLKSNGNVPSMNIGNSDFNGRNYPTTGR